MGTEQLPEGGPVPVPPPAEAGGSPAAGAAPAAVQPVDPVAVAAAAAAAAVAAAAAAPAAPAVDPAVAAAAASPPAMPGAPAAPVADPVAAEAAAAAVAAAAAAPAAPAADPGAAAAAAAAAVAAAAIKAQQPAAVINLVDRPDLEVPEAFGRTVNAAQNIAGGGGAGVPPPPPISGAPGAPPPSPPAPELSEAKILERPYKYDPEESRDTTRQTITLWLIGLLCAIVVLAFVALFASGVAVGFTGPTFFDGLKKILDVLVGPVITLLASAVGFYFGSKQGESVDPAKNTGKTPS